MKTYNRSVVEINLAHLEDNFNEIKRLTNDQNICVVVKADAYGHGALYIAKKLVALGVNWLAVATVAEGVELREGGVLTPNILLFACDSVNYLDQVYKYNLTPTIYSLTTLKYITDNITRPQKFHLEIDTGMGRTGISAYEIKDVLEIIKENNLIHLEGCFTHFSCADDIANDYTINQLNVFKHVINEVLRERFHLTFIHASNSAGILITSFGNLVRPGLLIYGISPLLTHSSNAAFKPLLNWFTYPLQIKQLSIGNSISYNCTWTAKRKSTIAIIPVGYADGYCRLASNKGYALVNNQKAPIIGNICMDYMMLDVTSCGSVGIDSKIVLIGTQGDNMISVNNLASWSNTIPYEIMCNIGKRAEYVYLNGDNK